MDNKYIEYRNFSENFKNMEKSQTPLECVDIILDCIDMFYTDSLIPNEKILIHELNSYVGPICRIQDQALALKRMLVNQQIQKKGITDLGILENEFKSICQFKDWKNYKNKFIETIFNGCRMYLDAVFTLCKSEDVVLTASDYVISSLILFLAKNVDTNFNRYLCELMEMKELSATQGADITYDNIEDSVNVFMEIRNLCLESIAEYYKEYKIGESLSNKTLRYNNIEDMNRILQIENVSIKDCCILKDNEVIGTVINGIIWVKEDITY